MIRILADFFIIAVMGHRLEPWSQALSRFKRTLENQFSRVRNSLWMLFPITAIIKSAWFFSSSTSKRNSNAVALSFFKYTKEYGRINVLCDFSPFGAPQGNGQNALLLGREQSRERKKFATTVANFTLFYNGIMVSLSLLAGSVETISIISPCGKQILVWPGWEIQPVCTAIWSGLLSSLSRIRVP